MNEKSIFNALTRAGLDYKPVALTEKRRGVMVYHDYEGIYPDDAARRQHAEAVKIAGRYKLKSEPRGHYTATLIYFN